MILSRRSVLVGLLAAPIVCRPGLLMRVRAIEAPTAPLFMGYDIARPDSDDMSFAYVSGLTVPLRVGDPLMIGGKVHGIVYGRTVGFDGSPAYWVQMRS